MKPCEISGAVASQPGSSITIDNKLALHNLQKTGFMPRDGVMD